LILQLSPYKFEKDPKGSKDLFWIQWDQVEYEEKPGASHFEGTAHSIVRSIRIPYTFYWA